MTAEHRPQDPTLVDEGSWAYLIGSESDRGVTGLLRDRVIEACEASGWPAVSWPPAKAGHEMDPGHLFEGVRHAVEHADVVVAMLGVDTGSTDAELAMAYGHRRPIVGVQLACEDVSVSATQAMLKGYERARMIVCADVDGCAAELRAVLSDPDFAATIHAAAGEYADDA
jgi:hypothetical protein